MLTAEIVAAIILESMKLLNWQLSNLPKEQAAEAAARFDHIFAWTTQWMVPKA